MRDGGRVTRTKRCMPSDSGGRCRRQRVVVKAGGWTYHIKLNTPLRNFSPFTFLP
jgi:hypothetical protein